jgi:TonB family protein
MATENNIKSYTAADIEKYHKGLLTSKEMHELEKAALDDAFLADALEGFAVPGTQIAADINELKNRLAERIEEEAKVITIKPERSSYRLLRAAVVIAFIAGAGLLVYQLGFNKKSEEIARNKPDTETVIKSTEKTVTAPQNPFTTETAENKTTTNQTVINNTTVTGKTSTAENKNARNDKGGESVIKDPNNASDVVTTTTAPTVSPAPGKPAEINDINKSIAKDDIKAKEIADAKRKVEEDGFKDEKARQEIAEVKNNRAVVAKKTNDDVNYRNQATNVFRGRVTDQNNIGVPFANVTNLEDNAGTYTDAKGNFILTYPDSVLTVQVRSIGFENNNIQLRNSVPNNQVFLQDDRSLSEVVISNKKPNVAARSRDNNMKLEEPEPADGWDNYDSYLVNNVKLPEEYVTKQKAGGEVVVSFEVDKNGEPISFKIEKSLCKKCDQEAIRLIKDGPKWKRKIKHGRTTVTITF